MIACPRPARSSCEGLTALETAVVLFITAIVAVPLLATAWWVVDLPVKWRANVEAARDAREILRQVADDARQASCFSTEDMSQVPDPENGAAALSTWTFTWVDYTPPLRFFEVEYSHLRDAVVRKETISVIDEDIPEDQCEPAEGPQISETIWSVAYFDIIPVQVLSGDTYRCLIHATVRPSRPESALLQKIAAMMRPDNARCE